MIPDRVIDDDTKLWRFRSVVLPRLEDGVVYRVRNPVPVSAGGKLVGFASVWCAGAIQPEAIVAEVAVDYALPERLDAENGVHLWTLPRVTVFYDYTPKDKFTDQFKLIGGRAETYVQIHSLQITEHCTDVSQPHIGSALWPLGNP